MTSWTLPSTYLERGWPVIPAVGKQPAVAWSTYQRKLPSTKQVRKWFARRDREYNLAIITGRYCGARRCRLR